MSTVDGESSDHDLDYDRIIEMSDGWGHYDNGWQRVWVWCRLHNRVEEHWVSFDDVPEAARLQFLPRYRLWKYPDPKVTPFRRVRR